MTFRERRQRLAIGFASIALLGASPALAADAVRSEIEAANKIFEAAVSRSDGPGVAALYTGSAQLLPVQSDFVTGTEAIGQFWQAAFDSGMKGVSLVTREVLIITIIINQSCLSIQFHSWILRSLCLKRILNLFHQYQFYILNITVI